MRFFIKLLLRLGITGAITLLATGYLGSIHPAFDTTAHLRLHLAIGLLALFIFTALFRAKLLAVVCLLAGLVGLYGSYPGTILSAQLVKPDTEKQIHRLIHFNLLWINEEQSKVINRIKELDPLFISLVEASRFWLPTLKKLEDTWPYVANCPISGERGGVMIFSKLPLLRDNDFCGDYGSFLKTSVKLEEGKIIDLGSVHTRWPWPASGPRQYKSFTPTLKRLRPDALIAGDFNATTWSWSVQNFAANGGLKVVNGIGPTWLFEHFPSNLIRWLGLPIDGVMHKGHVNVLSAEALEPWGSDHLPVLVHFQID